MKLTYFLTAGTLALTLAACGGTAPAASQVTAHATTARVSAQARTVIAGQYFFSGQYQYGSLTGQQLNGTLTIVDAGTGPYGLLKYRATLALSNGRNIELKGGFDDGNDFSLTFVDQDAPASDTIQLYDIRLGFAQPKQAIPRLSGFLINKTLDPEGTYPQGSFEAYRIR